MIMSMMNVIMMVIMIKEGHGDIWPLEGVKMIIMIMMVINKVMIIIMPIGDDHDHVFHIHHFHNHFHYHFRYHNHCFLAKCLTFWFVCASPGIIIILL